MKKRDNGDNERKKGRERGIAGKEIVKGGG